MSGQNEIAVYEFLLTQREHPLIDMLPELPGERETGARTAHPEFLLPLLGYMRSDKGVISDGFIAQWGSLIRGEPPPAEGTLWLVFRDEGFRPLGHFATQKQKRATGLTASAQDERNAFLRARGRFVKAVCQNALGAISWLHSHGAVHRSLGQASLTAIISQCLSPHVFSFLTPHSFARLTPHCSLRSTISDTPLSHFSKASLLLNTLDQSKWLSLDLKIGNLGFATTLSLLTTEQLASIIEARGLRSPLEVLPILCLDDLRALGFVLLELIINAFAPAARHPELSTALGAPPRVALESEGRALRTLLGDGGEFANDVARGFRRHVLEQMPGFAPAVALLDEQDGAGWTLIEQLIRAPSIGIDPLAGKDAVPTTVWKLRVSAKELLRSPWFASLGATPGGSNGAEGSSSEERAWDGIRWHKIDGTKRDVSADSFSARAFVARWQQALGDWWVALPALTREGLKSCFGALGLFVAQRWAAPLAAMRGLGFSPPTTPNHLTDRECESLPSPSRVELPEFPGAAVSDEGGATQFRAPMLPIPMIPELLPHWRALDLLGRTSSGGEAPRPRASGALFIAAIGGGFASGAGAAVLLGLLLRCARRRGRGQLARHQCESKLRLGTA